MSSASFYTDRTQPPTPRVREEVPAEVWRGLVALIHRRVDDGSFAREFPLYGCNWRSDIITGTDKRTFETTLGTLIPQLRPARDLLPA